MNIFTYTYSNLSVGYEGGTCIDLTSSGDVIVGGVAASSNLSIDQFYCKLNSSGLEQWVVTWDNSDGYDGVVRIEEVNGTIYSAGVTAVQTNAWRYVTQKMSSFDGSISNTTISSGGAETIDTVSDFVVDAQDNLYVLGSVEISTDIHDGKIVKLDDNLNVLWEYQFDGLDGLDDQFRALTLDQNDNPVVAGHTTQNGNKDIQIIKFTSSGSISWSNSYNSQYGLDDMANDIVLNTSNDFIVGGTQETEFAGKNIVCVKFDSLGNLKWNIEHNGVANKDDQLINVALSDENEIVFVGQSDRLYFSEYLFGAFSEKEIVDALDYPQTNADFFIPQVGQILHKDSTVATEVEFASRGAGVSHYFNNEGVSIVQQKNDTSTGMQQQRIDVIWNKNNPSTKVLSRNPSQTFFNFYGHYTPEGACGIRGKSQLFIESAWTNVDIMVSASPTGPVYELICKPGFDSSALNIEFQGQDSLAIDASENAIIHCEIGSFNITKPLVREINSLNQESSLTWNGILSSNGTKLDFNFGPFNTSSSLIITFQIEKTITSNSVASVVENLEWSTYVSGPSISSDNAAVNDIKTDAFGNLYSGGFTRESDFPILNVLEDDIFESQEGTIAKFDNNHSMIWCTYFGDLSLDQVNAVEIGSATVPNNLYICGMSLSDNLPGANPTGSEFSMDSNDNYDGFIARMNPNSGVITWKSFIGSDGKDACMDLTRGPQNSIIVIGNTKATTVTTDLCSQSPSDNNFPLCDAGGGAYYQSSNLGDQDGFIMKFDINNEMIWSTLFGDNEWNKLYECTYDFPSDRFVIVGRGISSSSSSTLYPNAYTQTFVGGGFLSVFDGQGVSLWGTAIRDSHSLETCAISYATGETPKLLVAGITTDLNSIDTFADCSPSTSGFPICSPPDAYVDDTHDQIGETGDALILSFELETGLLEWSSLVGGLSDEVNSNFNLGHGDAFNEEFANSLFIDKCVDIVADNNGNFYLCGITSQGNLFAQFPEVNYPGYYSQDPFIDGTLQTDIFLMGFTKNYELFWSTIFGGGSPTLIEYLADGGSDWISELTIFNNDCLYMGGATATDNYPYLCPSTGDPYCMNLPVLTGVRQTLSKFTISNEITVNLEETQEVSLSFDVYPNPTSGEIKIISNADIERLQVFDYSGKVVFSSDRIIQSGSSLNLGNLSNGVYVVSVQTAYDHMTKKLIIQQ